MKHICKRLTALMLTFALMAAVTPVVNAGEAFDAEQSCILRISRPSDTEYPELADEGSLVADLYMVASFDGSSYTFDNVYGGYTLEDAQEMTAAKSESIAQATARIALYEHVVPTAENCPVSEPIENLEVGLYLVILHGADLEPEDYAPEIEDDTEDVYTIATTPHYAYRLSPILISLPALDGTVDPDNIGSGVQWTYDNTISLKVQQVNRFGSIVIENYLQDYVKDRPAAFVYEITATNDKGEVVYSDVASIIHSGPGSESIEIEGILMGATVTVNEVYSGVCYKLTSDESDVGVIDEENVPCFNFVHAFDGRIIDGGGFTTTFTYEDAWNPTARPHKP